MLFNVNNTSGDVLQSRNMLTKQQCNACPLLKFKQPDQPLYQDTVDVLFVSNYASMSIPTGLPYTWHKENIVECIEFNVKPKSTELTCCAGRKGDLILKLRPKVVVAIDYSVYRELENLCGLEPPGIVDRVPLPTVYKGHEFWLIAIPQHNVADDIMNIDALIEQVLKEKPNVLKGTFDGIEFITSTADIKSAFKDLHANPFNAMDIETTALRPYNNLSEILSIAIGTVERTFAFPLLHPQTPSNFDVGLVMEELMDLPKHCRLIAHNLAFELEWLGHFLGIPWLYAGQFDDTMAQAMILNPTLQKSLNFLIRKNFGFDLKSISDIDVLNLKNEPLERVLLYNALDTKYTHPLWIKQNELIVDQGFGDLYNDTQIPRIQAAVHMQILGVEPNQEFLDSETKKCDDLLTTNINAFRADTNVKNTVIKYGKCEPLSLDDLKNLFFNTMGLAPNEANSLNDEFLTSVQLPIAENIQLIREHNKAKSTWLDSINPRLLNNLNPNKMFNFIFDDGLCHTQFNTLRAVTFRLSSSNPNLQNWPSRGGRKYLRNVVRAPKGHTILAIDYGQVEFRVAVSMCGEKTLIAAVKTNYDIHMEWTIVLVERFPGVFVADPTNAKEMKSFRSSVKNCWTFPLLYGAAPKTVMNHLAKHEYKHSHKITQHLPELEQVIKMFWSKHPAIKPWQESLHYSHNHEGFVSNPFGRKWFAPMDYNGIVNYPVQSTASDIVVTAMCRLSRMSVEQDIPWLCPRINIHDDLTFYIPDDKMDEAIDIIVPIMLDVQRYEEWLKVPLSVELSTGPSWGALKELVTISSDELQ